MIQSNPFTSRDIFTSITWVILCDGCFCSRGPNHVACDASMGLKQPCNHVNSGAMKTRVSRVSRTNEMSWPSNFKIMEISDSNLCPLKFGSFSLTNRVICQVGETFYTKIFPPAVDSYWQTFIVHTLLRRDGITLQITVLTLVVYHCSNLVDFRLPFWRNISSVVVGKGGRDEGKLIFRSFILNCAAGRLRRLDKVQLIG